MTLRPADAYPGLQRKGLGGLLEALRAGASGRGVGRSFRVIFGWQSRNPLAKAGRNLFLFPSFLERNQTGVVQPGWLSDFLEACPSQPRQLQASSWQERGNW